MCAGSPSGMLSGSGPLARAAQKRLADLRARCMLRTLTPVPAGAVNLCSNDYLGLLSDAAWQAELRRTIGRNAGAGASRLLGGEDPVFAELESAFSQFKDAPASLLFASGYAANESVVQALAGLDAHFFSDQLNHASIIDGCRLARLGRDRVHVFAHADLDQLRRQLNECPVPTKVIITESVFSMDGDWADLPALYELAQSHQALLVIDEAHAMGVWGRAGRGWIDHAGLSAAGVVSVNPLGKAWGLQGAIVSGPEWFRQLLINEARPFIYTTGCSPWLADAALQTLKRMPNWETRRCRVRELAEQLRRGLCEAGFATDINDSPIVPVIVGAATAALDLSRYLLERGFFCRPVRPPTVPEGTCRVRLSLTAAIRDEQLDRLLSAIVVWGGRR